MEMIALQVQKKRLSVHLCRMGGGTLDGLKVAGVVAGVAVSRRASLDILEAVFLNRALSVCPRTAAVGPERSVV
jgi:hypothetical protein